MTQPSTPAVPFFTPMTHYRLCYESSAGVWVATSTRYWWLRSALRAAGKRVTNTDWMRHWRVLELPSGRIVMQVARIAV